MPKNPKIVMELLLVPKKNILRESAVKNDSYSRFRIFFI